MLRLPVFALLAGALALPAAAQHGGGARGGVSGGHMGGGGGGFHGGFSGSAPVSHSFSGPLSRGGAFSPGGYRGAPGAAMRPGMSRAARYPGYSPARAPYAAGALRNTPRLSAARPTFYSRFGGRPVAGRPGLYRNPYRGGYGRAFPAYGYGYPGFYPNYVSWNFLDWDLLDWDATGWNPNTEGNGPAPYADTASAPYAYDNSAQSYAPPQTYAPEQPVAAQPAAGGSAFSQPSPLGPAATTGPAPLRPEDAITIVFKDGRSPVHARNYALTRDAILLTSPRLHEIPLAEVDLPATERINHAAGLDFSLPQIR